MGKVNPDEARTLRDLKEAHRRARMAGARRLPVKCACGAPAFRGGYCSIYCEIAAVVAEADRDDGQRDEAQESPGDSHDRAYHGRCRDDV